MSNSLQPSGTRKAPDLIGAKHDDRPGLLLEILVVSALAVFPHIFNAVSYLLSPWDFSRPLSLTALADLFQAIQESVPVLFIMHLCGRPWSYFGIKRPSLLWDSLCAVGILLGLILITISLPGASLPDRQGLSTVPPEKTLRALVFSLTTAISLAFAEELVMRGYLVPRLEEFLGSTSGALILSALLFTAYHIHKGVHGAAFAFFSAMLFGGVFCFLRRLWPLVLAHAVWNLIGFFL